MIEVEGASPCFAVPNVSGAVNFYRSVLGFQEVHFSDDFAQMESGYAVLQFRKGEARGGIEKLERDPGWRDMRLYVSDADKFCEIVKDRGGEVLWGPDTMTYGRREFAVEDPFGYVIIISSPAGE